MPLNLPTHAHGHGYTDLNFVIPELVSGIQYKKGPYFVEDGDFTTAGSANVNYVNVLDETIARLDGGSFDYARGLLAGSPKVGEGNLLYALEGTYDNGPWTHGDNFRKFNGVLRYSVGDARNGFAVTAMGYSGKWDSTDQIAERAVDEGVIGRFGSLNPTEGGETHRYSLSAEWQRSSATSVTRAVVYGIDYKLNLFSDFTYVRPHVSGTKVTHRWFARWFGVDAENEIGFQGRFDDIHSIGSSTRRRGSVCRRRGRPGSAGERRPLRADGHPVDEQVPNDPGTARGPLPLRRDGISDPQNGGTLTRGILSPKMSMIFGPFNQTEIYANGGYGFHSNDARGATITFDPSTGEPAQRVTPLARAKSGDRSPEPAAGVETCVLEPDIDSELIFVGDAGTTEASRPSRRYGVEWSNSYRVLPWLTLDADLSLSKARFRDDDPAGPSFREPSRTSSPRASRSTGWATSSAACASATSGRDR